MNESTNLPLAGEELNSPVENVSGVPIDVSHETPKKGPSQTEVNDLISYAKQNSYKLGYEKAKEEIVKVTQQNQNNLNNTAPPSAASPNIEAIVESKIEKYRQELDQKNEQAHYQVQMDQLIGDLTIKTADAKNRYSDYAEVTASVDFSQIPEILALVNVADNAGDVLYELAKNPAKIGSILNLVKSPDLAKRVVMDISNSIKRNQSGQDQKFPKEPLDNMKPSNVGSGNGQESMEELKAKYRG